MSLKNLMTKAGIITDDHPSAPVTSPPDTSRYEQPGSTGYVQPSYVAPSYGAPSNPTFVPFANNASSDPELVKRLKASVFGDSAILGQFLQNVETVQPSFPNDELAAMKAALAFTRVKKEALLDELNRTVAASLLHTKSSLENEHNKARDAAVGNIQSQLSSINSDIQSTQAQIAQLQSSIAPKQANVSALQGQIRDAEQLLSQQDAVVKASLSVVEQYVATLTQTFTRL